MSYDRDRYVDVDVYIRQVTERAVLVRRKVKDGTAYDGPDVWVPRSCVHAATDLKLNERPWPHSMVIQVRFWFAEREKLTCSKSTA